MVQLDTMQTILVFSHPHNSFDKKELLNQVPNQFVNETTITPQDFIKNDSKMLQFYLRDIDDLLNNYDPGHPKHKPGVTKQYR